MSLFFPGALARRSLLKRVSLGAAAVACGSSLAGSDAKANPMKKVPIVLVHGGWRGGWSWRRVTDRLQAAGHPVYAPSLTGLGDRSHLASPDIGLSTHVQDVVNLIEWEGLEEMVICGHSYGGMVITGAIERLAPRVRAAVYLDAFVPDAGASLWDHLPDPIRERFLAAAETMDGAFVPPPPAASFLVNEADRAWVDAKCTPQPVRTFHEPVGAVAARETIATKVYVSATAYNSPAFAPFVEAARRDPAWSLVEIAAGHDLMIDEPDRVAEIVRSAAG